ncbi:glutamic-type intramembrane protease PrsW [Alkalicoccus urumqiensis]|uniref:Protease PrsW n=1 Tax=Alkalicoccus urumqiensis TaxID=1548213 RepID=A0A2P6MKG6_ALKUR|nr:glutamic-type intramembrane protease PrsW [Alkalicoccus urumqiensis]PRO66792.1 PrsW family intramembrane metalloprotease [Alkalicoccus urumqiensis]
MISLLAAACAPAMGLLLFFYLRDELEPEPVHMVVRTYLFGALLAFPVMFIQYVFQVEGNWNGPLVEGLLQAALVEESAKWLIVLLTAYFHVHFNQRYDGIVYAGAVALGFATVENILYLSAEGLSTAFSRAFFPVSLHALMGVVMGYYLGAAKFSRRPAVPLILSLAIPVILHGIYNAAVLTGDLSQGLLFPFMLGLWMLGLWKVKRANQEQHREHRIS